MQQQMELLVRYVQYVWINRKCILLAAWLILPIGFVGVSMIPDTYRASAKVYVDTDSLLRPLLRGLTVSQNYNGTLNTMSKTLLSRTNVERIISMADLDLHVTSVPEREKLIRNLTDEFKISHGRRENLYSFSILDEDPVIAKRIVDSALTVFIDNAKVDAGNNTDEAKRFIISQIKEYEKKLKKSENERAVFKKKYAMLLPSTAGEYYSSLHSLKNQLREAKLQQDLLQKQLETVELEWSKLSIKALISSKYQERLDNLNQQLDTLLIRYTEQHPTVREVRGRIFQIENKSRDQLLIASTDEDYSILEGKTEFANNPVVQSYQLQVATLKSQLSAQEIKVQQYLIRKAELESFINTIPEIEAKEKSLNRDYELTNEKYLELLKRKGKIDLSNSMESETKNVNFKVIEPPLIPDEPENKNKTLLYVFVIVVAYGVGAGVAFLVGFMKPVTYSSSQISAELNIDVYGEITVLNTINTKQKERIRTLFFWISNVVIVTTYVLFVALVPSENIQQIFYQVF